MWQHPCLRVFTAFAVQLGEELDEEDVLELEFDKSKVGAIEAGEPLFYLPTHIYCCVQIC